MWSDRSAIPERRLDAAKYGLVAVIAVTTVLPLSFVSPDEASLQVNIYKYLAKTGAFVGSMLMIWQFLLGFRGVVSRILPDLSWVTGLHTALGQFGVPLIVLHPVFIGLYYAEEKGRNIFALDLGDGFSEYVLLGMIALGVVALLVVTSAFLRGRLGFYPWLYTHLSSYLVPPLLFVHSFALGPTVRGTALNLWWWFLAALVLALFAYRAAHKLGVHAARYRVNRTREVAEDVTEILLEPVGRGVRPAPGQFVYLRPSIPHDAHPFTVSAFDDETGTLGVTAKKAGPLTARLQDARPDDPMLLDGPFGVFTRPAMATDLPVVIVAGGIGITAFRRLWQRLERDRDREAHLFYANETFAEIAYRDELESLEHVRLVHVLNDEPDFEGEQGLVTLDVLRRHLPRDPRDYQFLLCGPPPMVTNLGEELAEAGVPARHVRHELFES